MTPITIHESNCQVIFYAMHYYITGTLEHVTYLQCHLCSSFKQTNLCSCSALSVKSDSQGKIFNFTVFCDNLNQMLYFLLGFLNVHQLQ